MEIDWGRQLLSGIVYEASLERLGSALFWLSWISADLVAASRSFSRGIAFKAAAGVIASLAFI